LAPRCRKAGKGEKSRILDEYLALSGSKSRKYAIFKLNRIRKTQLRLLDGQAVKVTIVEKTRKKRVYQPYYDAAVAAMPRSVVEKLQLALRETVCTLALKETSALALVEQKIKPIQPTEMSLPGAELEASLLAGIPKRCIV
jgi:hypothetical protein